MERERIREREPEQHDPQETYEKTLNIYASERERAQTGKIVIRARDIPWRQNRQALVKIHSGKHRHQGGIQLFILEGEGSTTVDGDKFDWEKWDLVILPVKPRGCEHQHFNKTPGKTAMWMAFQYDPFNKPLGRMFEQVENSPDWKGK